MVANNINTIGDFFQQADAHYRVFDMGRRVREFTADQFSSFEAAQTPYSYPFNRCALMGIIFWDPNHAEQHYVWFVNFPLDEQALLKQNARDQFLRMLLERVDQCILANKQSQAIQDIKDSPYSFVPTAEKMAAFNAQATKALALPPSVFYQPALEYLTSHQVSDDWQSLAMQGIADVVIRLEQQQLTSLMATIPQLPKQVFTVFSHFLEHGQPNAELTEVFCLRIAQQLQQSQPDITDIGSCLRAISNSLVPKQVQQIVSDVLAHQCSRSIEILATIASRMWGLLKHHNICQPFLEQLAVNDAGQQGFNALIADLLYLPGMRSHIMQGLQAPQRSQQLIIAVAELFSPMQQATQVSH